VFGGEQGEYGSLPSEGLAKLLLYRIRVGMTTAVAAARMITDARRMYLQ
jgi:hypothetical protein